MQPRTRESDIIDLERRYWDAMKQGDVEAAVSLTRFPCTLTSPRGVQSVTEAQYRKIMAASDGSIFKDVEIGEPRVQALDENAALITYQTMVKGAKMLDMSTWVREAGKNWVCAHHSEHPLQ